MHNDLTAIVRPGAHIHFIGIGGVGMSALARVLCARGFHVSGSDVKGNAITRRLEHNGCAISFSNEQSMNGVDCAVISSAIPSDHAEVIACRKQNIPVIHRSEMLGFFMNTNRSIGVTGTHGKTTTSALISFILTACGLHPTCFVGGDIVNYHDNTIVGNDDLFVAEVDESDRSLLNIHPKIMVFTNLEEEHHETYNSLAHLQETIHEYIVNTPSDTLIITNNDDDALRAIMQGVERRVITYGISTASDIVACKPQFEPFETTFALSIEGHTTERLTSTLGGLHNVYNCLAAASVCHALMIPCADFAAHLPAFKGTARRLEVLLDSADVLVVDDYAHHPTEIQATISALAPLRSRYNKLTVVFQPHRYSRTKHLYEQFSDCFAGADDVIITDLYSAGETAIEGVSAHLIYDALKHNDAPCSFVARTELADILKERQPQNEIIAFLGAGDITETAHAVSTFFKNNLART